MGSRKLVFSSHYMAVHASVPAWIPPTDQLRLHHQQEQALPLCEGAASSFQPTSCWHSGQQELRGTSSLAAMLQSALHATEAVGAATPGSSWGSPGPLPATVHQVCRNHRWWTPVPCRLGWHCCRFHCCLTAPALWCSSVPLIDAVKLPACNMHILVRISAATLHALHCTVQLGRWTRQADVLYCMCR